MENLLLDVGSGSHPKGDVNVDAYINATIHRSTMLSREEMINFVLADAQHLPFKNGCFETVQSSHLIEHLIEPMIMLKEMVRVSSRFIIIRCPHRFALNTFIFHRNKAHVNKFNVKWFKQAFEMLGVYLLKTDVVVGLFGIPEEIRVKGEKRN